MAKNTLSGKTSSDLNLLNKVIGRAKRDRQSEGSDYGETFRDYGLIGVAAKATYRAVTGQPIKKQKSKGGADFDNSDFFNRIRDIHNDELQLNVPRLIEDALENPTGTFKRETYVINQKLDRINETATEIKNLLRSKNGQAAGAGAGDDSTIWDDLFGGGDDVDIDIDRRRSRGRGRGRFRNRMRRAGGRVGRFLRGAGRLGGNLASRGSQLALRGLTFGGGVPAAVAAGGAAATYFANEAAKGEAGKATAEVINKETDTMGFSMTGAMAPDWALGSTIQQSQEQSEAQKKAIEAEREKLKNAPWYTRLYGIGKDKYLNPEKYKNPDLPVVNANPSSGMMVPGGPVTPPITETAAEKSKDPVLVIPTTLAAGTYYLTTDKPTTTKTLDVTPVTSRAMSVGGQVSAPMGGGGAATPKISIPTGVASPAAMQQAINPPTVATPSAAPFVSTLPQVKSTGQQLSERAGLTGPSTPGMPAVPAMGTGSGGAISGQGITPRTGPLTAPQASPTRAGGQASSRPGSANQPIPVPKAQIDPDKIIAGVTSGDIRPKDAVVEEALKMKGLSERSDRQTIQKYLASGGKANAIDPSQTPWCSAFVNASMARAGIQGTGSLQAASWHNWGEGVQDPSTIKAGDVMVRNNVRSGSGSHVEIATGPAYKDKDGKWKVPTVGGNSSDQVKQNVLDIGSEGMTYSARRATEANYTPQALAAMKSESRREGAATEQASKAVEQANLPATGATQAVGTMTASQKPGEDAMAIAQTGKRDSPIPVPATATPADSTASAPKAPTQVQSAPSPVSAPQPTPNPGRAIPSQARAPDPMQQMMGMMQTFMGNQPGMPSTTQPTPMPRGIGDFGFRKGEMPWGMAKTMSRDSQGVTTMFDAAGGAAGIFAGGGQEAFQ